jgi:uncharacterized protein YndB with AHSA1/START domain
LAVGGTCGVRITRYYDASPGEVWAALTDAASVTRWLASVRDFDLSRGGGFDVRIDGTVTLRARVRHVERERLLELDWSVPGEAPSVVRFELKPVDAGTVLALDHSLVDARVGMRAMGRWETHLRRLDGLLADGRP